MFDEMLVYLLGRALEDVGMESHRSNFYFRFMIMDYVILDFALMVLEIYDLYNWTYGSWTL